MGMFDYLRCDYPLPARPAAQGEHVHFQTKSFDNNLDTFHLREDGSLWEQEYDIEDRSDPNAEGLDRLMGSMTRTQLRWRHMIEFTGEIEFHCGYGPKTKNGWHDGFIRFQAQFIDGQLTSVAILSEDISPSVLSEETAGQLDQSTQPTESQPTERRRL